jgi:hypothetical protein
MLIAGTGSLLPLTTGQKWAMIHPQRRGRKMTENTNTEPKSKERTRGRTFVVFLDDVAESDLRTAKEDEKRLRQVINWNCYGKEKKALEYAIDCERIDAANDILYLIRIVTALLETAINLAEEIDVLEEDAEVLLIGNAIEHHVANLVMKTNKGLRQRNKELVEELEFIRAMKG